MEANLSTPPILHPRPCTPGKLDAFTPYPATSQTPWFLATEKTDPMEGRAETDAFQKAEGTPPFHPLPVMKMVGRKNA
jgi:hypothetical protein